ncbi:PTS transporter subunit EIIB [Pseudomonas atacamensis]|uniref:PTS transporter subunit EIIB n=1 Tax=Pseudomonas atacamensis TaxID=2565368 RepID=UPI002480DA0A|nr:PTS transporter subunit EIIB [Pseudomonas atacamensis]WGT34639.1 PTS transporter subunit EIIB [Pseudomonas atacamensis]
MFDKLQQAFWKALTPDLVPDEVKAVAEPIAGLSAEIVAALGGVDNLKSQQPLALTRVRVALHDEARVDRQALSMAGVAGVMCLEGGVLHLITGLRA